MNCFGLLLYNNIEKLFTLKINHENECFIVSWYVTFVSWIPILTHKNKTMHLQPTIKPDIYCHINLVSYCPPDTESSVFKDWRKEGPLFCYRVGYRGHTSEKTHISLDSLCHYDAIWFSVYLSDKQR